MNGTIKKVVADRGFGFITGEDGVEYFFHADELRGLDFARLKAGDSLIFETKASAKGPRAVDVHLAETQRQS